MTDNIEIGNDTKNERTKDDLSKHEGTVDEVLRNLLVLGDKFNVPKLKTQASYHLAQRIQTSNVLKTLEIACQINGSKFVDFLVTFINKNITDPH